jgi:hypothetical protein
MSSRVVFVTGANGGSVRAGLEAGCLTGSVLKVDDGIL